MNYQVQTFQANASKPSFSSIYVCFSRIFVEESYGRFKGENPHLLWNGGW